MNKQYEKGKDHKAFLYQLPAGLITFFLIAVLVAAFMQEQLLKLYERLGFTVCVLLFVCALLLCTVCYAFYARAMDRIQYEENKGVFWKYLFTKKKLQTLQKTEQVPAQNAGGDSL